MSRLFLVDMITRPAQTPQGEAKALSIRIGEGDLDAAIEQSLVLPDVEASYRVARYLSNVLAHPNDLTLATLIPVEHYITLIGDMSAKPNWAWLQGTPNRATIRTPGKRELFHAWEDKPPREQRFPAYRLGKPWESKRGENYWRGRRDFVNRLLC